MTTTTLSQGEFIPLGIEIIRAIVRVSCGLENRVLYLPSHSEASPEQLSSLQTKNTPVHCVRFGAANYLVASGIFLSRPDDH